MFCRECGNQIETHARFCSKCGREVTDGERLAAAQPPAQPPARVKSHDMNMHVTILAWLLIGSGILTGILALIILFAGQFVQHLPLSVATDADFPVNMRPFVAWIISVVGLAAGALSAGVCAAGVGLLQYRDWARTLAIIVSVFLIFHFPIGTAIAIYAFWVLFSKEGQEFYKAHSVQQGN